MICVISGSNRRNSECLRFTKKYIELLKKNTTEEAKLLALELIPHNWFHPDMYEEALQTESLAKIQDEYILPAHKMVFIIPEYNGGFPGSLKLFIDGISIRSYKETFKNKKAALVGIASGRAGNLRGMDHMSSVLNHVGTIVMPNKLPISRIEKLVDANGNIDDAATIQAMEKHVVELLNF